MNIIETERLMLRTWDAMDSADYYRMNQDPKVIEFLPGPLTMPTVIEFMRLMNQQYEELGYTLFAVVEKATSNFIGFIGLNCPNWQAHFTPCVEIGWRLGAAYWNKGYATEGAKAILHFGFTHCNLTDIVSFTVPQNTRSIRVMEKIGMQRDLQGDFFHPKLAHDHKLAKHVLYRIKKP